MPHSFLHHRRTLALTTTGLATFAAPFALGLTAPSQAAAPVHPSLHVSALHSGHGATVRHDRDHDGMPNRWERANGLDPRKANARGDADKDGLVNLREFRLGTDPQSDDTDDDGITDEAEADDDSSATDPTDADTDDDGVEDGADDDSPENCPADGTSTSDDCSSDDSGDDDRATTATWVAR